MWSGHCPQKAQRCNSWGASVVHAVATGEDHLGLEKPLELEVGWTPLRSPYIRGNCDRIWDLLRGPARNLSFRIQCALLCLPSAVER